MKSRKIISGLVLVALVAILFFVPSLVFAEKKTVYNIGGKYVTELPNIKWEDGDPGDLDEYKVDYLGTTCGVLSSSKYGYNNTEYVKRDSKTGIINNINIKYFSIRLLLLFIL